MKVKHKFTRDLINKGQYRLCDGTRCDFAENVVWRWKGVTCKKCLEKRIEK
jgi:SUMO ligase MMS21 Smc5/6 complex component